jgi:hypothetical protein
MLSSAWASFAACSASARAWCALASAALRLATLSFALSTMASFTYTQTFFYINLIDFNGDDALLIYKLEDVITVAGVRSKALL